MHTTIYLHPQRTIIAHWDLGAEVPVLTSYREVQPDADVQSYMIDDAPCTVAVHSHSLRWHHFPLDDDEDVELRKGFELATCLPDVNPEVDRVIMVNSPLPDHPRTWCGMVVLPRRVADDIAQRIGPEAHIIPDVICDIRAALASTSRQEYPWVLLGLRGDKWIAAVIDQAHTVVQCAAFPRERSVSFEDGVIDAFYAITSSSESEITRMLLFGDELTKSSYDSISSRLAESSVVTGRLQPFRRVGAGVDDATKRTLLSIAHILGPIVAPVLPSFAVGDVGAHP